MNSRQPAVPAQSGNLRKSDFREYTEASLDKGDGRDSFNAAYREADRQFMRFLIPPGQRVLELGCGRGDLLAGLEPSYGVGVDFGAKAIARAKELHPDLLFVLGMPKIRRRLPGSRDHSIIS